MANMTCVSYVDKRLKQQNAKISQFAEQGVRMTPEVKAKLMDLTRQNMALNAQIKSGKITEEQYKGYMVKQLQKDHLLLAFFEKNGALNKAQVVKERIQMIQEEI